jgi:hypothetical protein
VSEQLLGFLQVALSSHGIKSDRRGCAIHAQDGLVIEPRVIERNAVGGSAQLQIDFAIESPRLPGITFLDSFGGVGDTAEDCEKNAFSKFIQGSFHVIAEALTTHSCDHTQVDWETWSEGGHSWRVCAGPLLLIASRAGSRVEGFEDFFPKLHRSLSETMTAGPHWVRVFLGSLDGRQIGSEVLVDGEVWPTGQALLDAHAFTFPQGYASFRHLLIALPEVG